MNIEQLYIDFNIPFATEGHKHCRPGWVNTECPFCTGNPGLHLGYDTFGDKYVCWRCGGKFTPFVIASLLKVSNNEANKILKQYGVLFTKRIEIKRKSGTKPFKLPKPNTALQSNHIKYLEKRNFDSAELEKKYFLFGTGVTAMVGKINYKHRIIIPFEWNKEIVSFDSRDITNKANNKYMACPEEYEKIGHKKILYGRPKLWGPTGICVEGPSDVWRMGENSFATSGIKYTPAQVRVMSKLFKRIFIMYDNEVQALKQAKKLASDLKFRNIEAIIIQIDGDPGAMAQNDADYLVKELMKSIY